MEGDFKMLTPEELLSHDIDHLRQLIQERKERDEDKAGGRSQAEKRKSRAKDREREKVGLVGGHMHSARA